MANTLIEFENSAKSGATLYAVVRDDSGRWWSGGAFEAYAAADWAAYATGMTEQGASGYFTAPTPSLPAGAYNVGVRQKAGASAAPSDASLAAFEAYWDGTGWHAGPAYADRLPSPPPDGYGSTPAAGTTAVTHAAGGTGRSPADMTVLDADSNPILGASVTAYLASAYAANPATATVVEATTTDVNGHWTLNLPAGAAYTLVFAYPGDQTATGSVTV